MTPPGALGAGRVLDRDRLRRSRVCDHGAVGDRKAISRELKMSQPERYEMLILGSGAGGKLLAWHMAKSGHRTAVVERKLIGGSCPNTNCLPSKNEIWSAKVADLVHHADRFGIVTGPVATDMKKCWRASAIW